MCYKYKLRCPSRAIVSRFECALELCRELYNAALQERRDAWRLSQTKISFYDQVLQLREIRGCRPDVAALYSTVCEAPLRRVDRAFKAFFRRTKRAGYPRFKSVQRFNSFTYRQSGFQLKGDRLTLSKLGSFRLRLSRPIEGKIKAVTIKREPAGWFAVFAVEESQCRYIPKTGEAVGVDVGVENFAFLSNGEAISNPQYLRQSQRQLATANRSVARKKLRGSNRRKAVTLLAKQHGKIARQRSDFFHKLSLSLIKRFDKIVVENLNIAGMVKNHCLAKSISDSAWGTFIQILTAKAESAGRTVEKVSARFTSQDCSGCGARVPKPLSQREHCCPECGLALHRDHNAAINILGRADRVGMESVSLPRELRIAVI